MLSIVIKGTQMIEVFTPERCHVCDEEIQPGQLYFREAEGPRHFGHREGAAWQGQSPATSISTHIESTCCDDT